MEREREMDQNSNTPLENGTPPVKKGVNSWLIALITVLVVGGIGATAFGFFKNQDPMALYMTAEGNTMKEQMDNMDTYYGDSIKLQERMYKDAYEANSTVTADFDLQSNQMNPMVAMVQGILSTAKVEVNQKMNPATKESYVGLDVLLQGTSLGNMNFYQSKDTSSLQVPFLYDQYFSLDNDKLGALLEKYGEPAEIKQIPNLIDYQQNNLNYTELKEITSDYVKSIADQLTEEQFSLEKNADYEGGTYNKVTITLSEKEAEDMVRSILNKLKDDQRIWDMYETQFALMDVQSGSQQDIIGEMKKSLDEAIKNVDKIKLPNGFVMNAYIADNLVQHRTVNFDLGVEDQDEIVAFNLKSDYVKDGKRYNSNFELGVKPDQDKGSLNIVYKEEGKPNKEGIHVDRNVQVTFDDGAFEKGSFAATFNTDYNGNESKTDFDVDMSGMDLGTDVPQINGFYNTNTVVNADNANQKVDIGLNLAMNDPYAGEQKVNVVLHVDQSIDFKTPTFPTISEDQSVNLMDTSEAELQQISMEIQQNLQQYYGNLFGAMGGFGGF